MAPWQAASFAMTVKFEHAVGPEGGGDPDSLRDTLRRIADHIGLRFRRRQMDDMIDQVFGGTRTFRIGRIGTWQEQSDFFDRPEVRAECEAAGRLFGYDI